MGAGGLQCVHMAATLRAERVSSEQEGAFSNVVCSSFPGRWLLAVCMKQALCEPCALRDTWQMSIQQAVCPQVNSLCTQLSDCIPQ